MAHGCKFLRDVVIWNNFTDFVIRSKRKILNRNAEQQTDFMIHAFMVAIDVPGVIKIGGLFPDEIKISRTRKI